MNALLLLIALVPPTIEKTTPRELPQEIDLSGYYSCTGSQGGETYNGVVIIQKAKGIYMVQWTVGSGTYIGAGHVVPGQAGQADKLIVGWCSSDGKTRGGNQYTIGRDRVLDGTWASLPGDGFSHPERLEFLRAIPTRGK